MKRFQFSFVVALLMAAVSAPAQRSSDVRGERNVRGGIVSSRQHVVANQRGTRAIGERARASRSVGNREGARRGVQRGARNGGSVIRTDPFPASHGRRTSGRYTPVRRAPVHSHGYWKTVCEPVLIKAGYWHREHVSAVYGWVYDPCGYRIWGIVEPAHYHRVWVPPCYEDRTRRVWVRY